LQPASNSPQVRVEPHGNARPATQHAHARPQCLAHPLDHIRHGGFLGLSRRRALRLLQLLSQPARNVAATIGRNPADGDPWRCQHAQRPDRRGRDHHARQERSLELCRALDYVARGYFRRGDHVHAPWSRARVHTGVAAFAESPQASKNVERRCFGAGAMMAPALELAHLSKRFGGLPATKNVSLSVMRGERRLIIGPNGTGKTTLFNLITGDLTAGAGSVLMFGRDLQDMAASRRVHLPRAPLFPSPSGIGFARGSTPANAM